MNMNENIHESAASDKHSPQAESSPSSGRPRPFTLRFLLALLVGLMMGVLCYLTAYYLFGSAFYSNSMMYKCTASNIRDFSAKIEQRYLQQGPDGIPKDLEELPAPSSVNGYKIRRGNAGQYLDHWGNPLIYETDGTTFTLISYARDGKPGGQGLDRDISNINWYRAEEDMQLEMQQYSERPTLSNFFYYLPTGGVLLLAALTGLVCFFAVLIPPHAYRRKFLPGSRRFVYPLLYFLMLLAFTHFSAMFLAQIHIYSGH